MSFFSKGFSSILNERHLKKASKRGNTRVCSGEAAGSKEVEEKKDEGRWDRLTDAYGRTYWQHSVTGEWSFAFGGGFVSPIVILVNPLIVVAHPGAVFTSSPVFPSPPPPPTKKEKKKDDDKKDDDKKDDDKKGDDKQEGKGWWATVYDEHGHRYWEHTVTKKATYIDPYY